MSTDLHDLSALRAIAEASPLPFVSVDPAGAVRLTNAAAEELLGVRAGGEPPAAPEARDLLRRALDGEVVRDAPLRWRRGDGIELELLVSAAPLLDDGAVVGAIAFALPVVDGPAKVENVVAVSRIAHDLNNVMTAIFGFSRVLASGDEANGPGRRHVERIAESAESALAISRRLAALARRAAERTPAA